MSFREAFIYNLDTTTLSGGTGTVFTELKLLMQKFDFEFKRTIHRATDNRIYKKIFDNRTGRYLFKSYDDLRSVSGTSFNSITVNGFTPFNWHVPYVGKSNAIISIFLSDFANAGNNIIDLSYHGDAIQSEAPLDMHGRPVDYSKGTITPIIYESPSIVSAAGVGNEKQGVLVIDNDADFICTKITGICTNVGYVTIEDTTRGVFWQNQRTHTGNLFGNGQFPNVLTSPRFIKKDSRILITFRNNHAAENTLNFYLHGYKRY